MPPRRKNFTPKSNIKVPIPITQREETLARTPIIDPQPMPPGECNQAYKLVACQDDIKYLPELVDLALRTKEQNKWQEVFQETGQPPALSQYPSPAPLQRLAQSLLNIEEFNNPDYCPPLPYGHAYQPENPRYLESQITTVGINKYLNWGVKPLLYSQQITQYAGTNLKKRTTWLYDDFNRPDSLLGAPFTVSGVVGVVNQHLQINAGSIAFFRLYTTHFNLTIELTGVNWSGLEVAIIYCNEAEKILMVPTSVSTFDIIEVHNGSSNVVFSGDFLPGNKFECIFNDSLTVIQTPTNFVTAVNVATSRIMAFQNTNPTPAGLPVEIQKILVGTDIVQGYPYDIFIEDGVNLRPLVENLMGQLTDLSDYCSSSLRQIGILIDYMQYAGSSPQDKPISWQTPGFERSRYISFWLNWLKNKPGVNIFQQGYEYVAVFKYDDGTGESDYHISVDPHIMQSIAIIPNAYTFDGIFNDPIVMTFAIQQIIEGVPGLKGVANCRNGVNIYLDYVHYVTQNEYTVKDTTFFPITGTSDLPLDNSWGGGWTGGLVDFDGEGYLCQYQYTIRRLFLFISPCATRVFGTIKLKMKDDPELDTDNDPNTPKEKVPQIYPMLVYMEDRRSNQTIGAENFVIIGEGEHIYNFDFVIQKCDPMQTQREVAFGIDDQDIQQKAGYPYKVMDIFFSTDDCQS